MIISSILFWILTGGLTVDFYSLCYRFKILYPWWPGFLTDQISFSYFCRGSPYNHFCQSNFNSILTTGFKEEMFTVSYTGTQGKLVTPCGDHVCRRIEFVLAILAHQSWRLGLAYRMGVKPASMCLKHNNLWEHLAIKIKSHLEHHLDRGLTVLGFGLDRIRTLVSMATDSSHRVIMGIILWPL